MKFGVAWIQLSLASARRIQHPLRLVDALSIKALAKTMFELCLSALGFNPSPLAPA